MVKIAREAAPNDTIDGATVAFGAPLIFDETLLAQGALAVAALFEARDLSGYDGAIIAAFGDPGLEAARATTPQPVTGIAEASMLEAAAGGRRFSVVTTTPLLANAIAGRADALGVGRNFAGVRLTDGDVQAVMNDPTLLEDALATRKVKKLEWLRARQSRRADIALPEAVP